MVSSHALTPYASQEAENGTLAGGATIGNNSDTSGGKYVTFGSGSAQVVNFHMINDADSTPAGDCSKYQIIQMQFNGNPTTKNLVDQYHANCPGEVVLMYVDPTVSSGYNYPSPSNGCVDPSQVPDSWMFYNGSSQISGKINFGNTAFDSTCTSQAFAMAKSADFNGIFWDEANIIPGYAGLPSCINAYQGASCSIYDGNSVSGWVNNWTPLLDDIQSGDAANNMKSVLNIGGGWEYPSTWQSWNGYVAGAMEESCVGSYLDSDIPYNQWQGEILTDETWSETNHKYFMCVNYDNSQNREQADAYGLASMLLTADGYSSFSSTVDALNDPSYDWWPEYATALKLGAPQGSYSAVPSGSASIYERKFANGIVVVNPTTTTLSITLPSGTYGGSGIQPTSLSGTVQVASQTGYILLNN